MQGVGGGVVGAYVACVGGAVGGASVVGAVLGTNAVIVGSVVVLDVDVSSEPGPTRSGLSMLRSVPHAARTTTARSAVAILLTLTDAKRRCCLRRGTVDAGADPLHRPDLDVAVVGLRRDRLRRVGSVGTSMVRLPLSVLAVTSYGPLPRGTAMSMRPLSLVAITRSGAATKPSSMRPLFVSTSTVDDARPVATTRPLSVSTTTGPVRFASSTLPSSEWMSTAPSRSRHLDASIVRVDVHGDVGRARAG